MIVSILLRLAVAIIPVVTVSAHTDLSPEEMVHHRQHVDRGVEVLEQCLQTHDLKQLRTRVVADHHETARRLRHVRGIVVRGGRPLSADETARQKWNGVDHDKHYPDSKDPQDLFGFKSNNDPNAQTVNASKCILTPENVWGPFWNKNHPNRSTITGSQKGVYMHLAMQVIDTTTCKPLPSARVDVWHANATGVYSNGKEEDAYFLRGWQPTSPWGTVKFETIFPGHYNGRNTHVHVAVRTQDKANDEHGFVHAGQIFFDEWPRIQIEPIYPYNQNKAKTVDNIHDTFTSYSASDKYDPFANWGWLGPNYPTDGLIAWITIGVNSTDYPNIQQPTKRFLHDHLED